MRPAGKTNCQAHERSALGYLVANPCGKTTRPSPFCKSDWWRLRTSSAKLEVCQRNSGAFWRIAPAEVAVSAAPIERPDRRSCYGAARAPNAAHCVTLQAAGRVIKTEITP